MTPGVEHLLHMAIIVAGKAVGWAVVAWEPPGLVREAVRIERRRRRKRFPEELQRTAELESAWAEILVEARSRTPERPDPDPHVLTVSRIPTP